jgi:hypothetical protein
MRHWEGFFKIPGSIVVLSLLLIECPLSGQSGKCIKIAENVSVPGINANANVARLCIENAPETRTTVLEFKLSNPGEWTPNGDQIKAISQKLNDIKKERSKAYFFWVKVNGENEAIYGSSPFIIAQEDCDEAYPSVASVSTESTPPAESDKAQKRSLYEQEMAKKKDIFWILLDEDLGELYRSPDSNAVQGNPIYVGVLYKKENLPKFTIDFSPCSLEPESPLVFVHDETIFGKFQSTSGKVEYGIHEFPPRSCWNDSVTIKVSVEPKSTGKNEKSFIVNQYRRYRATLQMGVLLSGLQETSFGLRAEGEKKIIFNKGPENNGPVYAVSLILYSLPKYLKGFLGGKPYKGRDIINEWDLFDRIGGVVGVDITKPTRRFIAGISFDVLYGVSVFLVREWALLNKLVDVKEGDSFDGNAEEIPIRSYWGGKWTFGISLDLRYVTALFQKK